MAVLKHRLSKKQIESEYTHYALMFCIVPIYFNENTNAVCTRNWWPEWLFDLFAALFDLYCIVVTTINPEVEPLFPIKIGKPIKGDSYAVD